MGRKGGREGRKRGEGKRVGKKVARGARWKGGEGKKGSIHRTWSTHSRKGVYATHARGMAMASETCHSEVNTPKLSCGSVTAPLKKRGQVCGRVRGKGRSSLS